MDSALQASAIFETWVSQGACALLLCDAVRAQSRLASDNEANLPSKLH
jgi:hypothetical protein